MRNLYSKLFKSFFSHIFSYNFQKKFLLLFGLTIVSTFICMAEALDAKSSESPPPYLFLNPINIQDHQVKENPTIVRSRLVNVDFSLLPNPKKNFKAKPDGEIVLILNVFQGLEFTALIYKIEKKRSGSYSWYGTLKGIPMSRVVLVVNQNMVFGNISTIKRSYQIRQISDEIHAIYEIDPAKFPPTSDPIVPKIELKPAPSSLGVSPIDGTNKIKIHISGGTIHLRGGDAAIHQNLFSTPKFSQDAAIPLPSTPTQSDALSPLINLKTPDLATQYDDGSVIDILVVYTAEARIAEGGTSSIESIIDLAESETNEAYANSGVSHVINVVAKKEISFSESGFSFSGFLASAQNGSISGLHDLRNEKAADLVVVLVKGDFSFCGLGYLMASVSSSFAPFGYSVVASNCAAAGILTFPHEIGHNFGARHDRAVDNTDGSPFDFNHGYVDNTNAFKTIMAYGSNFRYPGFSNPNVKYNGAVTGKPEGNPLAADNRLTFQKTAYTVANFRQTYDSAFDSIVPFDNAMRVISPYWQSDDSSYSFISITHSSLSNMATQIGIVVRAIKNNGTLFGSATTFTIDRSTTRRIFIVRSGHPSINSSLTDIELITGSSIFQNGFLHFNPVASNPEINVGGFRDITMLNFWGAVVIEKNTTGFSMEFVGDTHDSSATPNMASSATVSGVN
jgi:hypothetical protein